MITFDFLNTEVTLELVKFFVWPEKNGQQNVVGRVDWQITFLRNGAQSRGSAQTLLNVDDLSNFVDVNQLTEDQILTWAYNTQGAEVYLNFIYNEVHNSNLNFLEKQIGLVPWSLNE